MKLDLDLNELALITYALGLAATTLVPDPRDNDFFRLAKKLEALTQPPPPAPLPSPPPPPDPGPDRER